MELKVGMTFTGSEQCFTGRVEILEVDEPNNRLRVGLTKKNETFISNWNEDWNLQHTIWGFERGDYFVKNFTDYPQDLQRSSQQQCYNIHDGSVDSPKLIGKKGKEPWYPTYAPHIILGTDKSIFG